MSRARPKHQPRIIRCRECGAPTELRDERTLMLVCQHCGAQLDLSEAEQKVLERGASRGIPYRLNLGERLTLRGGTYEVIARVCLIEDDDVEDQTHQYYLYHPTRRPLWLSEYEGEFDLTWRTRVRPRGDVFEGPGPTFTTHDGRSWRRLEVGFAEVHDVDGALPYVQRRGDMSEYVDLSLEGGSGLFEANRSFGEVEYGEGVSVSRAEVERALGRQLVGSSRSSSSTSTTPRAPEIVVAVMAVVIAVVLGLFGGTGGNSGQRVAHQVLPAGEHIENVFGPSFFVLNENSVVRVRLQAPLRNAWMYAQMAFVQADADTVIHVDEADLSFYSGYEGGESWSEGRSSTNVFVTVEEPGAYRLMLGGTSGLGESTSQSLRHSLTAEVFVDAAYRQAATYGAYAAFVLGLLAFLLLRTARALVPGWRGGWPVAVVHGVLQAAIVAASLIGSANGWGAPELEHPDGISIRQSSVSGRPGLPFFVIYNAPRSHLGGGVHAGK